MSKVFTSPGVSARPLNVFEHLREWYRAGRYGHRRTLWQWLGLQFYLLRTYRRRHRTGKEVRAMLDALSAGGYKTTPVSAGEPLRVESLEATMQVVTFTESDIKLK
jgi:hypothetical protein